MNFSFEVIQYLLSKDNLVGIELAAEQNDEESRDSEENKENDENREKTEINIDDFTEHNFHLAINLFGANSNFSRYFNNYSFNKVHDLNTPPPEFIS